MARLRDKLKSAEGLIMPKRLGGKYIGPRPKTTNSSSDSDSSMPSLS